MGGGEGGRHENKGVFVVTPFSFLFLRLVRCWCRDGSRNGYRFAPFFCGCRCVVLDVVSSPHQEKVVVGR